MLYAHALCAHVRGARELPRGWIRVCRPFGAWLLLLPLPGVSLRSTPVCVLVAPSGLDPATVVGCNGRDGTRPSRCQMLREAPTWLTSRCKRDACAGMKAGIN